MPLTKMTLSVDKAIQPATGTVAATATPDAAATDVVTIAPLFLPFGAGAGFYYGSGSGAAATAALAAAAGLAPAVLTFSNSAVAQSANFAPTPAGLLQLVMSDTAGLAMVGSPMAVNFGNPLPATFPLVGGVPAGTTSADLTTAGDNVIVPGVAGKRIYLIDYAITCAAGVSAYWKSSGGSKLTATKVLAAGVVGLARSAGAYPRAATAVGEGLVLNISASVAVGVDATFAIAP